MHWGWLKEPPPPVIIADDIIVLQDLIKILASLISLKSALFQSLNGIKNKIKTTEGSLSCIIYIEEVKKLFPYERTLLDPRWKKSFRLEKVFSFTRQPWRILVSPMLWTYNCLVVCQAR